MYKLKAFLIVWPTYLVGNIAVLSLVFYLCLEVAINAILQQPVDIGFVESIAVAVVILALRGMFNIKLEMD